jgi:hypothetical protein
VRFVGGVVGQFVEIPSTVRLRLGQRERGGDQAGTRVMVIALASGVELGLMLSRSPRVKARPLPRLGSVTFSSRISKWRRNMRR